MLLLEDKEVEIRLRPRGIRFSVSALQESMILQNVGYQND